MADRIARAEDIWLSAESLERQLTASGESEVVLGLVADVVAAARDLHNELKGADR